MTSTASSAATQEQVLIISYTDGAIPETRLGSVVLLHWRVLTAVYQSEYWRLSELAPACKNVWVSGLLCLLRVSVSSMLLYKSSRIIMYLARFTLCFIYSSPPLDLMMILCITFALAQDWHIDVFSKIRSNAFFCLWVISARFCIMTTSQLRLRTQAFTHRKLSHRECTQALSHIAAFTDRCSLLHKKHFPLETFTRKCFCTQEV